MSSCTRTKIPTPSTFRGSEATPIPKIQQTLAPRARGPSNQLCQSFSAPKWKGKKRTPWREAREAGAGGEICVRGCKDWVRQRGFERLLKFAQEASPAKRTSFRVWASFRANHVPNPWPSRSLVVHVSIRVLRFLLGLEMRSPASFGKYQFRDTHRKCIFFL